MKPIKVKPLVSVAEEKGAKVWVSCITHPMDGSPRLIVHRGFVHEADAIAFKSARQRSLRDIECICLTRERPPGASVRKGRRK